MRRVLAMLLLAAFSGSLIAPALLAKSESQLPSCCRRQGRHHCAGHEAERPQAPGPTFAATPVRCGSFPGTTAVRSQGGTMWLGSGQSAAVPEIGTAAGGWHTASPDHAWFGRSPQQRGPPVLSELL